MGHYPTGSVRLLILGGTPEERSGMARDRARESGPTTIVAIRGAAFPFRKAVLPQPRQRRSITLLVSDVEDAFPDNQPAGLRLILTQSRYLIQKWLNVAGPETRIIFTGDRDLLDRLAPEAIERRGAWRHFEIADLDENPPDESAAAASPETGIDAFAAEHSSPAPDDVPPVESLLIRAFASRSTEERLELCQEAVTRDPKSGAAALALASACREADEIDGWRKALDRAHKVSPGWEAAYYEDGKFWLNAEDMERARAAFQRATELMPNFSAAWSNLGATLGELDHAEAALEALRHALASDQESFTILNNIGVVTRELGRFGESEAALQKVVELAPSFVFGYYNLAHTRFLKGDYRGSLEAYEAGFERDPQKSRRQGCRLALARLANGDIDGAERDLWKFADQAPEDEREELLLEAYDIARSLVGEEPRLEAHRLFLNRITTALSD
jgi:tetratricopeptide (TPR) repeat protein